MTFTQSDIVPTEPAAGRAPDRRARLWAFPLLVVGMVAIATPIVSSCIPAKLLIDLTHCTKRVKNVCVQTITEPAEFALIPASAERVEPRLQVTGTPTYPSANDIFFVTIREPTITVFDWFIARNNPAADIITHAGKYGNQSEQQLLQSGQRQMTGAKDRATYVALKAAGFPVSRQEGAAVVDYLLCLKPNKDNTKCLQEVPAGALLQPDDIIAAVDGHPVKIVSDLGPILAKVKVGTEVTIDFLRNGKKMSGKVQTIQAPGEPTPRTIIGFAPIDTTTVKLPPGVDVQFDTGDIGGPSAGTAFTLTLIDQITKGNLMGPQSVAVTGEIDIDGNVGAIGGLSAKVSAVMQVGVKYFLVPASQPADGFDSIAAARKVVGNKVQLIPIRNIDDALAELRKLGGDPLVPVGQATTKG
ncbi:MAG: S16 family serine protease [Actinomycetota bacterium]